MSWTQAEAIAIARRLEEIAPDYSAHVALTGGCLYKDGERKDCDILFYRIRQDKVINTAGLFAHMERLGFSFGGNHGRVHKCTYQGKDLDLFFPEHWKISQEHISDANDYDDAPDSSLMEDAPGFD